MWRLPCLSKRVPKNNLTWLRLTRSLAYIKGPNSPPLLEHTVPEHFDSIVAQYKGRTAVVARHQNARLTYQQLWQKSNAFARGLQDIGVKKGDRVAVSLGNSLEYAIATYGVFRLGAILVPLNPAFTSIQVVSALNHLDVSHLLIGAETNLSYRPPSSNISLLQSLVDDPASRTLRSAAVPSLSQIIIVDNSEKRIDYSELRSLLEYNEVAASSNEALSTETLSNDDVINIQFTSGTTSNPKAASLTHRSILNNGFSIGERMLLTAEDRVCCPPPLFHCFGCVLGYMATATHGSAIIFPNEAFDAERTLKAVQEEQCTALYGVPTMFLRELDLLTSGQVKHEGFQYLRTGIAAGSSIPAELIRRLHRDLNLTELTICYGMTESSPVSCMTTTDDPIEKRINTVGRLLPHVEAKVVDSFDRTKILSVGERGELAVSGYLVMKEYWGDPTRTEETTSIDPDGKRWLYTGDEASIDADGYVQITGRLKDLIIRGGENIHPLEIENCLLSHPSISDVSVVGVKDEKYGETVAAFVVKKEGSPTLAEQDVRTWVQERMSKHLVPKHVFFVETFPKTASGKIQKFLLKEDATRLLAAATAAAATVAATL